MKNEEWKNTHGEKSGGEKNYTLTNPELDSGKAVRRWEEES